MNIAFSGTYTKENLLRFDRAARKATGSSGIYTNAGCFGVAALVLLVVAAAALSLASATMASEQAGSTLTAKSSRFGTVLFDSRGFVLYAFTKDQRRSACSGRCAQKWPAYVVPRLTVAEESAG